MPTALDIQVQDLGENQVITLTGSADMASIDVLTRVCTKLSAARPKKAVFDCSGLTFLASLAMGQFVALHKALTLHGGGLVLACASPTIVESLKFARLDTYLPMAASVEAALNP